MRGIWEIVERLTEDELADKQAKFRLCPIERGSDRFTEPPCALCSGALGRAARTAQDQRARPERRAHVEQRVRIGDGTPRPAKIPRRRNAGE